MNIWPWLHIFVAYLTYIVIAILTSVIVRKTAGDLKDFASRNSPRVLLLGVAANLLAMLIVILLLVFWDRQPVDALGLAFHTTDAMAAFGGLFLTFGLGIAFLVFLEHTGRITSLTAKSPVQSGQIPGMLLGLAVLVAIVLQEEVLNRGYITLNLLMLGPLGIILVSTTIFVLIHLLTNRPNLYQILSWIISGLVLALAYLLSGSLWVPIILHYATDAVNILVFNITGQFSFFQTVPTLSEGQRAAFRVTYVVVLTLLLVVIYGLNFKHF
jgi:membrane protease YdiL (CAAX protease family)